MYKKYLTRNRILVLLISVIVLVGSLYYYQTRKITLTLGVFAGSYWDVPSADSYQIIDDAIARFEETHPNVEIRYDSGILKKDYSLWLSNKIVAGEEPDIYMVLGDDFNMLSSLGALQPLDELMDNDSTFEETDFYESSLYAGKYQDTQYALPYESNPTLMFVNSTLLEAQGIAVPDNDWTLDDFKRICEQVTKDTNGDGVTDTFGYYNYTWIDSIHGHGAEIFDDEGTESYFSREEVSESITFLQELSALNQGFIINNSDFDQGRVAFTPMSFSQYRTYKPYPWRIKKYSMFAWDCIKMPSVEGVDGKTEVASLLVGMSNRTNHKDVAWEFLKEVTYNEQTQKELFTYSQGVSPLKEVTQSKDALTIILEDETEDSNMDMTVLNEVMENAVHSKKFKKYEGAIKMADSQITQMMQQVDSIDTALMSLQQEINTYLKE